MEEPERSEAARALARELERAVEEAIAGVPEAALAFSGGLDSSVLASLASRRRPAGLTFCTVGVAGSRDPASAGRAAGLLGISASLVRLEPDEGDVLEAARSLRALLPSASIVETAFLLPTFMVMSRRPERVVMTGDGADELFGGYGRYLRMGAGELARSLKEDALRLLEGGIQRNLLLARARGKDLRTPYLSPGVVRLASSFPPSLKVSGGERKLVLREAAALLGLPPELCSAPKRAAQYGSGVMKVLLRNRESF